MEAQKHEKRVAILEEELSTTEQEFSTTKQALEEKTTALLQARKHLKNSRERTLVRKKANFYWQFPLIAYKLIWKLL